MRIGNVTYKERAESEGVSPHFSLADDHSECTRVYDYPWSQLEEGAENLFGRATVSQVTGSGSGGLVTRYLSRRLPHSLPIFLSDNAQRTMFVTSCPRLFGLSPTGRTEEDTADEFPEYEKARIHARYTTPTYDLLEDAEMVILGYATDGRPDESYWKRFVTKVANSAGEMLGVPTGTFYYIRTNATTATAQFGLGKLLVKANLSVTWHGIPENGVPSLYVNPAVTTANAIENTIGKMNGKIAGVDTSFNGYAKGTLLLTAANVKPRRAPLGYRFYDVTYYFSHDPNGHTKKYVPQERAFLEVRAGDGATNLVTQTTGISLYDWADFRQLFRPPTL